jgi:hypothetical protein
MGTTSTRDEIHTIVDLRISPGFPVTYGPGVPQGYLRGEANSTTFGVCGALSLRSMWCDLGTCRSRFLIGPFVIWAQIAYFALGRFFHPEKLRPRIGIRIYSLNHLSNFTFDLAQINEGLVMSSNGAQLSWLNPRPFSIASSEHFDTAISGSCGSARVFLP